jgi:glycosyltransferase involved in cell wall biosynthesis
MKISIALCTYNGEKFLGEQLESFVNQTRLPDELVVGDDCSNDATIRLITDFAKTSPFPVRVKVNEKNLGSTKNFEHTILNCAGEIVLLSDQDDVWLPNKIERFETLFSENKQVGMIFTNAEVVRENLSSYDRKLWDFVFEIEERRKNFLNVLMRRNVVTGATMGFRAKFAKLFSPIPTDIPNVIHDGWISLVIAADSEVLFVDECLIKYRQHSNQQLGIDWSGKSENRRMLYENSLVFHQNELERIKLMDDILRDFPQFQTEKIQNSIDEIIKINLEEKNEIIKHYTVRMNLPNSRIKRISPIFRELQSGRYKRFSKGWKSAVKDLIESTI